MSQSTVLGGQNVPSQAQTPLVRRYNVERSCIRCHERKVRCNKTVPCSACTKADAQCRYPGPEKTKRRSQRGKQTQLYARLDKLERVLSGLPPPPRVEEDAGQLHDTGSPGELQSQSPEVSIIQPENHKNQNAPPESQHPFLAQGFLVKDGVTTRYINETLLSQVLEKESELQSAIGTPDSASTLEKRQQATFGFRGLISNPCISTTDLSTLFPTRSQATRLWNVWLTNVNPLVRLLHVPTTQPLFFAAINNPSQIAPDFSALLFSIYFAAVTSVDDSETTLILGQDRQSALNAYQHGLELSLHLAGFSDYPTIASIQAMSMYLMCRRSLNSGRSGWVLNGLLVRASQCIGLHRDGEHFKLSPMECEIRRRLWWHVTIIDGRVAEDHGIITGGNGSCCDTKFPLNINDTDLTADMKVPPQSREAPTEMTLSLVSIESNQAMQELHNIISQGPNCTEKVTRMKQILEDFKARIQEKYLRYCDSNVPLQRYAFFLAQVQIGKMEAMVRQQYLKGRAAENPSELACDESLNHAIRVLEICILMKTDELFTIYQWFCRTFVQYSGLTHVLWSLCVCPQSELAEKAWRVVERSFELEERPGMPELGQKWNVLRKLREKAISIRHALMSSHASVNELHNSGASQMQTENINEDIYNMAIAEGLMWDLDFDMISGLQAFSAEHDFQDRGIQL